jgi:RimJ/RimL family protein N-acetyltransferase
MEPHLQLPVGAPTRSEIRRRIERSGRLWRARIDLAIDAGGRPIGEIQARTGWSHGFAPGVFELGIEIWDRDLRGRGHGSEAIGLITRWLFEEMHAARVQLSTSVENIAMRASAEKLGYEFEGTLKAYWPRPDGGRDDYAMYAITSLDRLRGGE